MTILDLLAQRGLSPVKATNMHGGEYVSPCPKCGGSDCFRVWPALNAQDNESGIWFCRRCSQGGDLKKFLQVFGEISVDEIEKKTAITPEELAQWRADCEREWPEHMARFGQTYTDDIRILRLLNALEAAEASAAWWKQECSDIREIFERVSTRATTRAEQAEAELAHVRIAAGSDRYDEVTSDLIDAIQKAEAENARLREERDWLAERCAELCDEDENYGFLGHDESAKLWKRKAEEAARRAVEEI